MPHHTAARPFTRNNPWNMNTRHDNMITIHVVQVRVEWFTNPPPPTRPRPNTPTRSPTHASACVRAWACRQCLPVMLRTRSTLGSYCAVFHSSPPCTWRSATVVGTVWQHLSIHVFSCLLTPGCAALGYPHPQLFSICSQIPKGTCKYHAQGVFFIQGWTRNTAPTNKYLLSTGGRP